MEHVLKTRCAKTFIAKTVKPRQLTAENERLRASPTMCTVVVPLFPPLRRLLSVCPRLSPILKWGDGESGHRFLPSFRAQESRILGWERRAFAPMIGRNWTRRPSVRRSAEPSLGMRRTEPVQACAADRLGPKPGSLTSDMP
jgi:hypothetical protein